MPRLVRFVAPLLALQRLIMPHSTHRIANLGLIFTLFTKSSFIGSRTADGDPIRMAPEENGSIARAWCVLWTSRDPSCNRRMEGAVWLLVCSGAFETVVRMS